MESSAFTLHQLFPDGPAPRRADPALFGTAPHRAVKHCEPFTTANACGWHVFLGFDVILRWDGTTIHWLSPVAGGWLPLGNARYPGTEDLPASSGSRRLPPFLSGLAEPGLVQIWPGLVARSPEDWLLAVRPPVNLPRQLGYEVYEGIIDTAWWFGPLIVTVRLCKTNEPVILSSKLPLYTLMPLWRPTLDESLYRSTEIMVGPEEMTDTDWDDFDRALALHGKDGRAGGYKRAARARKREREREDDV